MAWRGAGGMHANDLLAAHATAPPEVVAALTAPPAESTTAADAAADADAAAGGSAGAAVAAPPALPPELAASLAALHARQSELLEELAGAADMLRFWGRRGEKAAAGSEPGGGGREGDVPPQVILQGISPAGCRHAGALPPASLHRCAARRAWLCPTALHPTSPPPACPPADG